MRRRWWKGILAALTGVAILALALRWGLLDWLVADGGTVRNIMEGLSWPAGVFAFLLAVAPSIRSWLAPPAIEQNGHRTDNSPSNALTGRALHLMNGRLANVNEVGLLQMGVRPAINAQSEDGLDLPPYVQRDFDDDLEWAIASSRLVLLHGRAATGKSRTAAEAVRRLRPFDPLWVPSDGRALRELATLGLVPENAVIWLDDLERYIGSHGLNLEVLQRLRPIGANTRTVVVATMRDEELSRYISAANHRELADLDRAAIDLISQIPERCRIAVANDLSRREQDRAWELGERDGRIRRALEARQGFAEYLAAGKQMLDRWSIGGDSLFIIGQALISVAVDCRRAGYHKPLPTALLDTMYPRYLQSGWQYRADLPSTADGLNWAHQRVLGASSCLAPYPEGTHMAEDYLLDRAQSGQSPLPKHVNDALWFTLLDTIDGRDAFPIGYAALTEERWDVAEVAFRNAVEVGDMEAVYGLAALLIKRERQDEAEQVLRRGADAGDTGAMARLAALAVVRGRRSEAVTWFRNGVAAGDTKALAGLGEQLAAMGHTDEAEQVLRRGVEAGEAPSMFRLARLLIAQGNISEAENHFRLAAETGYTPAHVELAKLLVFQERFDEAVDRLRTAVRNGDDRGLLWLVGLLLADGREDEAEPYIREMVDAGHGDTLAMLREAMALMTSGQEGEFEEFLSKTLGLSPEGDSPHSDM